MWWKNKKNRIEPNIIDVGDSNDDNVSHHADCETLQGH